MKGLTKRMLAVTLALAMTVLGCVPAFAGSEAPTMTVEKVYQLVEALPDVMDITIADKAKIEEATKAYDLLSDIDKSKFDEMDGSKSSQPMGRELESAQWKLYACEKVDNSTTLADGEYSETSTPSITSEFSKGKSTSGRQRPWIIENVMVKEGKAIATIKVQSKSYTYIITNGEKYTDYKIAGKYTYFYNVPIDLNGETYLAGYSDAMENEIMFKITNKIDETPAEPAATPYKIVANHTGMFKIIDAYEKKVDGKDYLYITLSGDGYHELFKGTYDEAVATGSDSSKWIIGHERTDSGKVVYPTLNGEESAELNGAWQFAVPINPDDTYIQLQALSNNHKKDGFWWYPRYININQKDKTVEAGDYRENIPLDVTNKAKMFKVDSASFDWVGGPHSNNYRIGCLLKMGSKSFTKAYVGPKEEAEKASEKDILSLREDNIFDITVEKIVGRGKNVKIESIFGEKTKISFYSEKSGKWFEKYFTFDKDGRSLLIENVEEKPVLIPEIAEMTEKNKDNGLETGEDKGLVFVNGKSTGFTLYIKNAEPKQLESVYVNDKELPKSNYTVKSGSIQIDLKKSYLESLDEGKYDLTANVKDESGKLVKLSYSFTVKKIHEEKPVEPETIPYKIVANHTGMFKVIDVYEKKVDGKDYLYITLSGDGYHELFKGTYDEAVATGSDSSKWIIGHERTDSGKVVYPTLNGEESAELNGAWQFAVPINPDDTYIQLQALSNNHKKDGFWWYPRYININQKDKTIEAGDYRENIPLDVINKAKMFKVDSASFDWVGGPHSNNYRIGCLLKMGSKSFTKAYVGPKEEAEKASEKDILSLREDNIFDITVEKIVGRGKNAKIESIFGEKTKISFYSEKSGKWFEKYFTFDKDGRSLLIEDVINSESDADKPDNPVDESGKTDQVNPKPAPENKDSDKSNVSQTEQKQNTEKGNSVKASTEKTPSTGDEAPLEILILIMGLAGLGIVFKKKSL